MTIQVGSTVEWTDYVASGLNRGIILAVEDGFAHIQIISSEFGNTGTVWIPVSRLIG